MGIYFKIPLQILSLQNIFIAYESEYQPPGGPVAGCCALVAVGPGPIPGQGANPSPD